MPLIFQFILNKEGGGGIVCSTKKFEGEIDVNIEDKNRLKNISVVGYTFSVLLLSNRLIKLNNLQGQQEGCRVRARNF